MCGIAGIVQHETPGPLGQRDLLRMLGRLRHRGPDQTGIYVDDQAALGSVRLSIIDLPGGQQPIGNEDGNLWIVFNGEIFNYLELRSELQARGHRFATSTDTEVALHAFEEFGPDCLNQFNGQFALAIWDRNRQELFLARDRLGVRPLFYCQAGAKFVFASEAKALMAIPDIGVELDRVALQQVFTYWCTVSPRTAFRNILSLPPAHYLVARAGRLRLKPYWTLSFPAQADAADSRSTEEWVERFRGLLIDAVKLRLRADVAVGAYLSGGLDSSTIAAVVRLLGGARLETFSIAFSESQFDESRFQRRMAEFLGTDHHVVHAACADIGRVFPQVVWHAETPLLRTAPAPMFLLSQLVRSHNCKVVLTGEGADEFLAGYDIFKEAMLRRFWQRHPGSPWPPRLLRRLYPDIPRLAGTSSQFLTAFFASGLHQTCDPCFSHALRWNNTRRTQRFFSDELKSALAGEPAAAEGNLPPLPRDFWRWHPLARAQYLEISLFFSQYLLSSQGDRPAMAHSVEGRFPFLDVRLVEFCNHLPARLKLCGFREKMLLRRTARQWLPQDIWQRGKRPYRAPIHRCFFNPDAAEYVHERLSGAALRRCGLFNPGPVEKLVAKVSAGGALGETDDMALVGILSTQLLHQLFVEGVGRPEPVPLMDDLKTVDCRAQALAN